MSVRGYSEDQDRCLQYLVAGHGSVCQCYRCPMRSQFIFQLSYLQRAKKWNVQHCWFREGLLKWLVNPDMNCWTRGCMRYVCRLTRRCNRLSTSLRLPDTWNEIVAIISVNEWYPQSTIANTLSVNHGHRYKQRLYYLLIVFGTSRRLRDAVCAGLHLRARSLGIIYWLSLRG